MATRVVIVEDSTGTREALSASLTLIGLEVVGAFSCGEDAVAAIEALAPDIALVDLGLPGISGAETIRQIRERLAELPALVLTVFETPASIVEAIEAGASGYLLKGTPLDELSQAIDEVRAGLSPISPAVARHLLARVRSAAAADDGARHGLTPRELEILKLLVGGHTYQCVADTLGIQFSTVQSHIKNVYRKLKVCSKAEAVAVALRSGLLSE